MNKEQISARLIELSNLENQRTTELAEIRKGIAQREADIAAIQGAIHDCQYWLNEISKTESTTPTKEAKVAKKTTDNSLIKQHKRIAMGEKVTGMKEGGKVCAPKKKGK